MAVTVTPIAGGSRAKRWTVTWALAADTNATFAHGFPTAPDHVEFYPLNTAAYKGLVFRGTVDATNITLTKTTDPNSLGAQVEVVAYMQGASL